MIAHEEIPIGDVGQEAAASPGFFTQIATGFAKSLPDISKSAMDIYKSKIDARAARRMPSMPDYGYQPQYPPGYQPQGAYPVTPGLSTGAIVAMVGGGLVLVGLLVFVLMSKQTPSSTA